MKVKAIDVHVHLHTTEGDASLGDARQAFGAGAHPRSTPEGTTEYYRSRGIGAVLFDVDKEVSTGQRIDNATVAEVARNSDGLIVGFASVDPHKGERALDELQSTFALFGMVVW